MDIDSEPKQPSAPAMASSEAVDRLSEILAQLEETPENVAVILQAIDLMGQVELIAEQLHTMDRLSSLVILGESMSETTTSANVRSVEHIFRRTPSRWLNHFRNIG